MNSLKYLVALFIMLFFNPLLFGQKESANWYFGEQAGLNFNTSPPIPHTNGQLVTKEGCAAISDYTGALLFYTDGITVWNRSHQVMPNGTGLLGHTSSTMSALIIPKPGNASSYYIFTIDQPSYYLTEGEPISGISYSEVDMTLQSEMGDIVTATKNTHLVTYNTSNEIESEYKTTEKITAVTHRNGSFIWVITYFIDKFYAFLIDDTGINLTPVVSTVAQNIHPRINNEGVNISAIGYLKVSPDGKKIAIAHSSTTLGSPRTGTKNTGKALLYDFNNATGIVTNQQLILENSYPYGVEFSPNSKVLYLTASNFNEDDMLVESYVYQYNIESSNVRNSRQTINSSSNVAGALQLAINGKIYRAGYPASAEGSHLSVINAPNYLGFGCAYSHNSIYLAGKKAYLGLPPFIQSIFKYSFTYANTCFGDATTFEITSEDPYDSVFWDFGDGSTSVQETVTHTYTQPGNYTVSLILSINGISYEPLIKQVTIVNPPNVMADTYTLVQCDTDENTSDGVSTFNLDMANQPISLYTLDPIQVFYYTSLNDAIADAESTNALPNIYESTQAEQLIYAKIFRTNTTCFNIATVRLVTTASIDLGTVDITSCDDNNNGFAQFNLEEASAMFLSIHPNIPSDIEFSFYENSHDASLGVNPLPSIYSSTSTLIFVRAESNLICYGNGMLNLTVASFPPIEDFLLKVCPSDFPISISPYEEHTSQNYSYHWDSGETLANIAVNQPGDYQVVITDSELGCTKQITITVVSIPAPQVQEVIIQNLSATIELVANNEDYQFALNNSSSNFQTSNIFNSITPGEHTVFIKDMYNCAITSYTFYVLGFPKFITPNGDSMHDVWNVKGLEASRNQNTYVKIFDRYGKLLKMFSSIGFTGWDGTFNGKLLPEDDYWYRVELTNGQVFTGHFTLKF